MSNGNICCVGQQIISQAIYADSSLTKTEVANVFAVKRPSIWRYDKLIYYIIKDYREDYPLLPNDLQLIKKRGCKRDRTVPLTSYQSWVLSLVRACFIQLGRASRVKEFIQSNPYLFTKDRYFYELKNLAKTAV